jgi:hypothetical protein
MSPRRSRLTSLSLPPTSLWRVTSVEVDDRSARIRAHIEIAHREVQAAQRLAYKKPTASLGIRLALNRAQNTLIKLIVHGLRPRDRA